MDAIQGITETIKNFTSTEKDFRGGLKAELEKLATSVEAIKGIADKLKGQLPIGLLALKAGVTKEKKEIIEDLPKTENTGNKLRKQMKKGRLKKRSQNKRRQNKRRKLNYLR